MEKIYERRLRVLEEKVSDKNKKYTFIIVSLSITFAGYIAHKEGWLKSLFT